MPRGRTVAQEQKLRAALAKGFREGGTIFCQCCPVRHPDSRLWQRWTDMHERVLRSRGGDPCDEYNIVLLCRDCHDYIHKNPEWATKNGFMEHGNALH